MRSILVNTSGYRVSTDQLYNQGDIVYPNMDAALAAVDEFRRGNPHKAGLGHWEKILSQFDPFRDGRSRERLRELIQP